MARGFYYDSNLALSDQYIQSSLRNAMLLCPCCSNKNYSVCCQPFLDEQQIPQTPEQLMRSRYTAYSQNQIDYIKKTMKGNPLLHFNEEEAIKWAHSVSWLGLEIRESTQETSELGFVEFVATFIERNQLKTIHECSEFHQYQGRWYYVDGVSKQSKKKQQHKLARNTLCPCGSGKKFKNCHEG